MARASGLQWRRCRTFLPWVLRGSNVHVSALANKFVKDPHDVVKPGQIVKVKVLDVDAKRQRIALTMRLDDAPGAPSRSGGSGASANAGAARGPRDRRPDNRRAVAREPQPAGAMALAFAKLKK